MIGTALIVVSFAILAAFHETRGWIYASSAILGLGIGFSFASMANLVVEAVHPSKTGVATGINTIMRTIGGSLGGQIAATIVAAHVVASTGFPSAQGFELAFALSAGVMVLAFLAAFAIPKTLPYAPERPVRSEATPQPPAWPARRPRAAASDRRRSPGTRARSRLSEGARAPSARNRPR